MKEKVIRFSCYGFVVISFLLLLYRITINADVHDEIINLNISYRYALGDVPFYHCWDAYQGGDIFLAPFLWMFVKITGGTTGIVLYSRVIYIVILMVCGIFAYQLLKKYLDRKHAFWVSYVIVFFEFYSLFYLWYDSTALIFLLLGDLAIIKSIDQSKTKQQAYLFLLLAGIAHCCMVIAYFAFIPLALGIAVLIAYVLYRYYKKTLKEIILYVASYATGAIVIVIILITYLQVTAGLVNAFEVIELITSDRGMNNINFLTLGFEIIKSYVRVNKSFVVITPILTYLYWKSRINQEWFKRFVLALVMLPAFNQLFLAATSARGLTNYLSYIALWCVPLFYLVQDKKPVDISLLWVICLPLVFSAFLIPLVSLYGEMGPTKSWQMCLPGALVSFYYIVKIWKERDNGREENCRHIFAIVIATLLFNAYSYNFQNEPFIQANDKRMTEGIYWGIKVNPKIECMAEIEEWVNQYTNDCETILVSKGIRSIYLMTDLIPYVRSTERATFEEQGILSWRKTFEYFEYFGELPDLMVLEVADFSDPSIGPVLLEKYEVLDNRQIGEHHIFIYRNLNENK